VIKDPYNGLEEPEIRRLRVLFARIEGIREGGWRRYDTSAGIVTQQMR